MLFVAQEGLPRSDNTKTFNDSFKCLSDQILFTQTVTVGSKESFTFKTQSGKKYKPKTSCQVTFKVTIDFASLSFADNF